MVEALLGKDPGNTIDVATVGGAIAVALIAAAPVVLGACRSWDKGSYTILGLFLAAACTLSGAFGELWVMGQTARNLSVSWLHGGGAVVISVVLCALLAVYSVSNLRQIVLSGVDAPAPPPTTDTLKGARLVAAAIRRVSGRAVADSQMLNQQVTVDLSELAERDDTADSDVSAAIDRDVPRQRRSALL